jgi:tripartite ATP-independent transporter DctM subunit
MPIIILGGIIGGIVTPTEAAAVAVGYALFLGFVIYRNLSLKDLYGLFLQNAITVSIIAVIIACATILGWLLSVEQVPQKVASLFMSVSSNKYIILLLINVFLIFVGMFMDIVSALLILGPILTPLAVNLGVHPLHFGIMMCVNLNIALMTPPLGGCLFVAMIISKLSLGEIIKALWPYILVEFAVLFLIVYFPPITMFVPKALGFLG